MSDFDDKFKEAADRLKKQKAEEAKQKELEAAKKGNTGPDNSVNPDDLKQYGVNDQLYDEALELYRTKNGQVKSDDLQKYFRIDDTRAGMLLDAIKQSGADDEVDKAVTNYLNPDGLSNEEEKILQYSIDNHVTSATSSELSDKLKLSVEDTIDALEKLAKKKLVKLPGGLDSDYVFVETDPKKINAILVPTDLTKVPLNKGNNDGADDSGNNNSKPMISKSLYDQLKQSESKETKGLFSIATGAIDPKSAVEAHDMMNTSDQVKAFMTQQMRVELTRMVKLSETMNRLEDKYIDNAMDNLDNLSQEALETTMNALDRSMQRASDLIDKYYGDPELSIFIQDAMSTNKVNNANDVHSKISKDSREKVRNIATKLLSVLDKNPAKVVNATELTEESDVQDGEVIDDSDDSDDTTTTTTDKPSEND